MKAHYLIFHPEKQRQKQKVSATSMIGNQVVKNWEGDIYIDCIGAGNEDPFVFHDPWIYSYCHASQLKRKKGICYIQGGSYLLFVSGDFANQGLLSFDTVFLVESGQHWNKNPLELPEKFLYLKKEKENKLWKRHFKFPFQGQHSSVTHTYEAKLWRPSLHQFSFLPLSKNGKRASVPIDALNNHLANKIKSKIRGKYPVLLNDNEIDELVQNIGLHTSTKILSNIQILNN
jgi:hypothetical protein